MVLRPGTPLTVSVVAPRDAPSAWVRLVGDVDMAAEPALAEAIDRLDALALRLVIVDVAAVTFAGATLTYFVDTLHAGHPDAALVLRRPSPLIRHIFTVTGQDRFLAMDCDPVAERP